MKMKCPKCGAIFEGPVSFCPSCGTKLAMPAQSEPVVAQPVVQAAPVAAPAPAPAQPQGSKGKAIGFGIAGLLIALPVLVCDLFMLVMAVIGIGAAAGGFAGISEDLLDLAIGSNALTWCLIGIDLPFAIMGFVFCLVSGRQKVVKGLSVTAKVVGILAFVLYFVSALAEIAAIIAGFAAVGCALAEVTTLVLL